MADKPILSPVRLENGSFCFLKDKKLIVEVRNSGAACKKETITQVDFRGYGTYEQPSNRTPQTRPTRPLPAGDSVKLVFDSPADNSFNPDCVFYITVDVNNVLEEDPTTRNNTTRVVWKAMRPYLVVVANDKGELITRAGEQLKFIVQNQGTAYARSSKTRIEIDKYPAMLAKTPELEPGYTAEVPIDLPKGTAATGSTCTLSLDVEGVVHGSGESGAPASHVYQGSIP